MGSGVKLIFAAMVAAFNDGYAQFLAETPRKLRGTYGHQFNDRFMTLRAGSAWLVRKLTTNKPQLHRVLAACRSAVRAAWTVQKEWDERRFRRELKKAYRAHQKMRPRSSVKWSLAFLASHYGKDGVNLVMAARRRQMNLNEFVPKLRGPIGRDWFVYRHMWDSDYAERKLKDAVAEFRKAKRANSKSKFNVKWLRMNGYGWLLDATRDHADGIHAFAHTVPAARRLWKGKVRTGYGTPRLRIRNTSREPAPVLPVPKPKPAKPHPKPLPRILAPDWSKHRRPMPTFDDFEERAARREVVGFDDGELDEASRYLN